MGLYRILDDVLNMADAVVKEIFKAVKKNHQNILDIINRYSQNR